MGALLYAADGDKHVQLGCLGADFCNVYVEIADRILLELLLRLFSANDIPQSGRAMKLKQMVRAGAAKIRDGCLRRIQTTIQRQKRMWAPDIRRIRSKVVAV